MSHLTLLSRVRQKELHPPLILLGKYSIIIIFITQSQQMLQKAIKLIALLTIFVLLGIVIGYVWKKFTMNIAMDYAVKSLATGAALMILCYAISVLKPQAKSN
jgi:hypothetical protein